MRICRASHLRLALLRAVGGALWVSGLAGVGAQGQDVPPAPAPAYQAPTDLRELLKIDEPMRRFFGERLRRPHGHSGDQLRALMESLLQPEGLHFAYDAEGTFDARETFRQRRGNCVSFSFLVVAVAREFGYTASFQSAANSVRWERFGDRIVSVHHLNVRVEADGGNYVIDLWPELASGTGAAMRRVSDQRAFAQFYDTAGFFKLLHAQPAEALQFMTLATKTDPDYADAWANLGSLLSHLGNLVEARACFERSLEADSRCVLGLDGYVTVLRRLGSPEDLRTATKYERRAQGIRDRNPYYQQLLAERAQEHGDWVAAEKLLRRAIALKNDEPQFYEQWVKALRQLGREDDARRATAKLEKLRHRRATVPVYPAP